MSQDWNFTPVGAADSEQLRLDFLASGRDVTYFRAPVFGEPKYLHALPSIPLTNPEESA